MAKKTTSKAASAKPKASKAKAPAKAPAKPKAAKPKAAKATSKGKTSKAASAAKAGPKTASAPQSAGAKAKTSASKAKPAASQGAKAKAAAPKDAPKAATAKKATTKKAPAKKAPAKKASAKKAAAAPAAAPAAAAPAPAAPAAPTKVVPVILGKHGTKTYPEGSSPSDFQCFGPPATEDGKFDHARICDMGCFTQDGKDSNKYYHGAVVQQRSSKNWYVYFEWGRTGASSPTFQFVGCRDEAHAVREFAKQLHSKNDRRGEWVTIAGFQTLRAKKGKDCYLVRPQATRSTGLPDARSIKINEGAREDLKAKSGKSKKKKSAGPKADAQTTSLMRDLAIATVAYTRGSMADDSLPTQRAIDEARDLLTAAQERLKSLPDKIESQVKDSEIMHLTSLMYGRIPKRKAIGAPAKTWVLSKDNILLWQNDLDAFESALYATDIDHGDEFDPFEGMALDMSWIDPKSEMGEYLMDWWPKASNNRHGWIKGMTIRNLWKVERHADKGKIAKAQDLILGHKRAIKERPLFQRPRPDLSAAEQKRYDATNTALLFHGTRSVNVSGILREALRMPKSLVGVVITGAMFGPGLYFADDWKKSAGYTSLGGSYWAGGGGGVKGRHAFMFACDVVLGEPYVAPKWGGYTGPPKGHDSIYGKSGVSGVQNNEFIVFDPSYNQLRYLAEFST